MSKVDTDTKMADTEHKLPSGWRWVKLEEVIGDYQSGFACGERDTEGIVQVRMNNVDTRGNFIWNDILRVPRIIRNIDMYYLSAGDVLFNNTNSTELVGKSALFSGYREPIVYSNHFTRLRTVAEYLEPQFLASWLNHLWQKGVFAAICNRWIGQSAVKPDKLLALKIPLPPLSEQKRISAILNEQLAAVDKARAAAEAQLEAAKALPGAYLREVFPRPGQELAAGWKWVKLGDVCEIVTGGTPPRAETEHFTGQIPWIKPEHLDKDVSIDKSTEYLTSEAAAHTGLLPKGTVLVSCIGKIGKLAVAGVPLTTNQQINSLIPGGQIDTMYLYYCCKSYKAIFKLASSMALVPILNKTSFSSISVPLPPIPEQRRIAAILNEQLTAVDRACHDSETQLKEINALPSSLLRKAFNGEL